MAATPAVAKIRAAVEQRFPEVTNLGVDSCRPIAGSSTWSQHSYGNAWDIGGPTALLDEVYRWLTLNRATLPIGGICWKDRGGCDPRTHQDHIHVEGRPKLDGTPPCAGGSTPTVSGVSLGAVIPGLDGAATIGGWLSDGDNWRRIGYAAGGLALVALAAVLVSRDLATSAAREVLT